MSLFKKDLLFKTTKPPDLRQYIGKTVKINGQKIVIKTICGNRFQQAFYEINGDHLIGMLRFHAQMLGDDSITEEQFQAFEKMEMKAERADEFKKRMNKNESNN